MQHPGSEERAGRLSFAGPGGVEETGRRILLFVSPPGSISHAMVAAIEQEFGWISVRHICEPATACHEMRLDVQLVVVDQTLLADFQRKCHDLARICPGAVLAVMTSGQMNHPVHLMQIMDSHVVKGILPSDVNLDIWLSIIRIMLKGGTYLPPSLLYYRSQQPMMADDNVPTDERLQSANRYQQRSADMEGLTGRELEVLMMVARGCQNKIIAAELGLSEHTVKIHLHNIIRKLGVHNRTEAAAKYFEYANDRDEEESWRADGNENAKDGFGRN